MKLKTLSLSLFFVAAVAIASIFSVVEAKKGKAKQGPADPNMILIAKGRAVPVSEPRILVLKGVLCHRTRVSARPDLNGRSRIERVFLPPVHHINRGYEEKVRKIPAF